MVNLPHGSDIQMFNDLLYSICHANRRIFK